MNNSAFNLYDIDVPNKDDIIKLLPRNSEEIQDDNKVPLLGHLEMINITPGGHLTTYHKNSKYIILSGLHFNSDNPRASTSFAQCINFTLNGIFKFVGLIVRMSACRGIIYFT